ncbi:hypothetical protein HR12_03735, partial [Microbacterium sp. SUBG005]
SVTQLAREFGRTPSAGYRVGACVPNGKIADVIPGTTIPVMGHVGDVTRALQVTGADTVAITSADDLPADKVKQISWSLEAGRQHLVLAPSIIDIAGPVFTPARWPGCRSSTSRHPSSRAARASSSAAS